METYIITEGSSKIGFGHITRMLSIYQAFEKKGIKPQFIVNGDESIKNLLKDTNRQIYDWIKEKDKLLNQIKGADIAIIDSYLADLKLYQEISDIVKKPVYYDDNKRLNYPCGIVINGNIHAFYLDYPKKECIHYLLGTKYLPLRKEFWSMPEKTINENVKSVMITFGGDDIRNMTPRILDFLTKNFPDIQKNVVIGGGFKNVSHIEKQADKKTNLIFSPDANQMKNIMLNSDIAISAAGQTLYELARTGTPTVAVVVADNQIGNATGLKKAKFLDDFAYWYELALEGKLLNLLQKLQTKEKRDEKSKIGRKLVDGKGAIRIAEVLSEGFIFDK